MPRSEQCTSARSRYRDRDRDRDRRDSHWPHHTALSGSLFLALFAWPSLHLSLQGIAVLYRPPSPVLTAARPPPLNMSLSLSLSLSLSPLVVSSSGRVSAISTHIPPPDSHRQQTAAENCPVIWDYRVSPISHTHGVDAPMRELTPPPLPSFSSLPYSQLLSLQSHLRSPRRGAFSPLAALHLDLTGLVHDQWPPLLRLVPTPLPFCPRLLAREHPSA